MVSAARSCRPRESRSVRQAGITHSSSRVRTAAHLKPGTAPSVRMARMRSSRLPTVRPLTAVSR
jgi:hypothetical protein